MMRGLAALLLSGFLAGCAADTAPGTGCPAGARAVLKAELYFGRGLPDGGEVSEVAWQRFADSEITPRFGDGFTVEEASGQWRSANGIMREKTKHLIVITWPDTAPDTGEKLDAIRAAYKARFHQESVLRLETRGCGSF